MAPGVSFSAPEPLAAQHGLDGFASGVAALDDWLIRRARTNQLTGASRTFVASAATDVAAYYALASGSVALTEATGRMRRNMPDPIPVVILARLAVDRRFQGQGLGRALVRDAALRVLAASEEIGIRGLLVHAISEEAKSFYLAMGFLPSPTGEMMLMIPLQDLRASL